jgi:hypothetical protein
MLNKKKIDHFGLKDLHLKYGTRFRIKPSYFWNYFWFYTTLYKINY